MANRLIEALKQNSCYDHATGSIELMETHISWILLTGPYAYKIKKPLNLGFLDFTRLEDRRHFCREEIRLNKRLAPELYCDVVPITGSPDEPRLGGSGAPIEFAVKMIQFAQADRLDHVLERGSLSTAHMAQLARTLAHFHRTSAVAGTDSPFGTAERIFEPVQDCFDHLEHRLDADDYEIRRALQAWCRQEFERRRPLMERRKAEGFIRECHGDAHLANMILRDSHVILFDCIEFSELLRWIDVMSEIAFVTMDLIDRNAAPLAFHLLNHYLEATGDYAGLPLLPFYQVYRALVRAKIAGIRAAQAGKAAAAGPAREQCRDYLELARRLTRQESPQLWITHGLSGSGKTVLSEEIMAQTGAIRLRTDVERKRLFGLAAHASSRADEKARLYGETMTRDVYHHLAALAEMLLQNGFTVLIDGTFLKRWQRELLSQLARRIRVPFKILNFEASNAIRQQRIRDRRYLQQDASEADLRVLAWQQENLEPLDKQEKSVCLAIRTDQGSDTATLVKKLRH